MFAGTTLPTFAEESNAIEKELYFKHDVKRGLRDVDGRGVIAGLTNIPSELMEAGQIDGANGWQVIRHIKIPLVTNSITICTFLAISRSFMSFDMNLSLTAGGPYKSTELIAYKIYQTAFTSMEFGKGQAQAIVLFVIVAVISLLQVYFTRKGAEN